MITSLIGRFGAGLVVKVLFGFVIALCAILGILYLSVQSANTKIGTLKESLSSTKAQLETANTNLANYESEVKRVDDIGTKADETRVEYITIEKEVIREVIKYITSPSINRVNLPAEWVCIHDYAVRGIDPFNSTGTFESKALDFENYQCTQKQSVPDHEIIQVMTYNYAQCRAMETDYQELSDIVFGYKAKVDELKRQKE